MLALIADDDRVQRALLKRFLQQLKVQVREAQNGLHLLEQLEDADPDFVILDLDMPILDGPEALRAIRATPKYRDLPVIAVTGRKDPEMVKSLIALGVADYLIKPVQFAQFGPRVRAVMQSAGGRRETTENTLLAVDADPEFLSFVKETFGSQFEVEEAATGAKAVAAFKGRRPPPAIVLIGEGLELVTDEMLAASLRRLADQAQAPPPRVVLATATGEVPPAKASHFDGVIRKSLVPKDFLDAFQRVIDQESSPKP